DVSSGAERPNSPVIISATYPGDGDGSKGGMLTFDPIRANQRPGLALVDGVVYISWSSHCDNGPYHGWVIGYDQTTLERVVVYNDTPNGSEGGIWMSGQAPAVDDSGNLYLVTGNGSVDTSGGPNRGQSFLKLTRNGANLTLASWFTPYNWQDLDNGDVDLGSGGLLLIPGTTLAFAGGKEGTAYLVDRDNMGGLGNSITMSDNVVQSFSVSYDQIHGGPIWWDGPGTSYGYIWPASVFLQQYAFDPAAGEFTLPAFAQSPTAAPGGQPGGILALSAQGTNAGSGIVWAVHQLGGDANQQVLPGILHAYNAENVGVELWNSQQVSTRDSVGNFAKFVPPTVANGKVYLATFSNRLNVYGLLAVAPARLAVSPPVLNLGSVAVDSYAQASFVLTNLGGAPLTNGVATISPGPFTVLSGNPFDLPGYGTTNVLVLFSPTNSGTFTNTAAFTTLNAGGSTNLVTGTTPTPPPVTLKLATVANQVQLSWTSGTLQTAVQLTGPYTNITGAVSPYTLPLSGTARFFRVQVQ
ncbi:MAG TPA: hypothetical protein VN829_09485, partial [Dongiaceae bacterium]|nr:hypothetical protein [Dongiaceae bacterium]